VRAALATTADAWVSFFKKPRVWMMITAVFFYRFAEDFIEKIGPLFLMDKRTVGGLGLDNMALGNINGTFGTVAFVGGTLLGGLLAARYGLRRVFVLLAFALNVPHVTFFYLSQALPNDLVLITCVVLIEKLGYGLGTVGMMLYMMQSYRPGAIARPLCLRHRDHGAQHDADRDGERAHPGLARLPGLLRLSCYSPRCHPSSFPSLPRSWL